MCSLTDGLGGWDICLELDVAPCPSPTSPCRVSAAVYLGSNLEMSVLETCQSFASGLHGEDLQGGLSCRQAVQFLWSS